MIPIVDPQASRRRDGGRRPCPVVAVLSRLLKKGRRAHLRPQRSLTSAHCARFRPLCRDFLLRKGDANGGEGGRSSSPSYLYAERQGHATVVAVLVASAKAKANERVATPKGREPWPPGCSSCKSIVSWGSGMGAMMPFMGPWVARHFSADLGSRRRARAGVRFAGVVVTGANRGTFHRAVVTRPTCTAFIDPARL
jgi:hypothetical protein